VIQRIYCVFVLFLGSIQLFSQEPETSNFKHYCSSGEIPVAKQQASQAIGSQNGSVLVTNETRLQQFSNSDKALLKNNLYKEDQVAQATEIKSFLKGVSDGSETPEVIYDRYMNLSKLNSKNAVLMLDAFSFMKNKDAVLADKVVSNLVTQNSEDIQVLQIASKVYSAAGDYEKVLAYNETLVRLEPNNFNAHLNRALAKRELGKYQEALQDLLDLNSKNEYFSTTELGLKKTVTREIKNLISKHRSELNLSQVDKHYLVNLKYKARLVFEWNIPGAEFEIQFVNPKKRFFSWQHTATALANRLKKEVAHNYRLEEYEIYGDDNGEWVINAKYLGKEQLTDEVPLVLKASIYENFGSAAQTKEDIVIHFTKPGEKINVKRLMLK